jgi:signal transduction histidine kinase
MKTSQNTVPSRLAAPRPNDDVVAPHKPRAPRRKVRTAVDELQTVEVELKMQNEELRSGRAELEEAHARYFRHFDLAPVGFLRVSRDALIREANVLGAQLLGVRRSDLARASRPLLLHVTPASQPACVEHLAAAFTSGQVEECEVALRNPRGGEFAVRLQSVRHGGEDSDELCVALIDESKHERLEHELAEQKAVADEAVAAHEKFLAFLSHELRTPLTPVLAAVQEMQEMPGRNQDDLELLARTRRNLELEIRLLNDLLDANSIAHGKLQLDFQVVDLHHLLRCTIEILENNLHRRQIHLRTEFTALRHHVKADADRLQQVFWNLLSNSIKFTHPEGHLTVFTRNEGAQIAIEVRDDGIGLEPGMSETIFEPFAQGRSAAGHGGLGLGLAIARSMTEAHGGTLTATSGGLETGTSFWLRLRTAPTPIAQPPPAPTASRTRGQGHRLLLIEDHEDSSAALMRVLIRRGYFVTPASTAAEARRLCATHVFDLLICDLGLPDGNGIELFQELNRMRPMKGIALSGFGLDGDLARSRAAGFLAHLTKPVDSEDLHGAIQRAVNAA